MKNKELFSIALKLLSRKSYSEGEIREKLKEKAGEEEIETIIKKLKELKYINDGELAQKIVEDCFKRNKGFHYIINQLFRRKIPQEIIKKIEENFDYEREFKIGEEVFLKNRNKNFSTILLNLKSKGFSYKT
ncbi:RecX family transcriptional regulator, partial [bacterium]|nr:RecX family transcriptional regulator [bacterium]